MRLRTWMRVALPLAGVFLTAQPVAAIAPGWHFVGPGIEYQEFQLPDPNNVFVARMDRSNPAVTLESSIAEGRLSGARESVRSMAARYDQTLSYWGGAWGGRNRVVVAINGYYFDPNTGIPWRGQVHSGWYAKRFDDLQNGSGFAWGLERQAFIGGCVEHRPDKQAIIYLKSSETQTFQGINVPRGEDQLILYTPQYDVTTLTDDSGAEVLVEVARPAMVLPQPNMVTGIVREIRKNLGATPIPFDHVVLSAHGSARTRLLDHVEVGDQIGISQDIKHYEADCRTHNSNDWTKTFASIGGAFNFLRNGEIQDFTDPGANSRAPRTAIAFNDNYIFFIVVDGRNPGVSEGMTMNELATFARDGLQATWGIAQDGGGSSTMVVNGVVVNNTYCNFTDCTPDLTTDYSDDPRALIRVRESRILTRETASLSPDGLLEAMVANGMMMVLIDPKLESASYAPGDPVITIINSELRLGPGNNYAVIADLPVNSSGTIVEHANKLNGIFATGAFWWKASFGGLIGWIREDALPYVPAGDIQSYLPNLNLEATPPPP